MKFSYKKIAAAVIILTLIMSSLLIIISYRSETTNFPEYILKDYNGTVALYKNDEIVTVYDNIVLSSLPYADRLLFSKGIHVRDINEAETLIEDYDG